MSMQYIRDHYGVPAKRGAKITFQGTPYEIVGARGQYLRAKQVHPRGFLVKSIDTLHPTWEIEYMEDK